MISREAVEYRLPPSTPGRLSEATEDPRWVRVGPDDFKVVGACKRRC